MASVILKNVKKIYPPIQKKKSRLKDESATNLEITKDGVVAVQNFNMEIKDKEFVVLVGPSGCGKTTTLRMIAGLEEITSGEIIIGDEVVNELEPKDRDIAMVFQNYALYPHMTVYDNMAFAIKVKIKDKGEVDRIVREAAEILGITEYLDRKPKNLSGGQRQRVAIGRAIVRNPKVMLMDEPLSNLDAKLRNQMRAELIRLRRKISTTFVYVTHDQTEAMTLGDRIVVMKDGFVQQIGTPQEVFNSPANLFVASFIGTPQMNFLDADLVRNGDSYELSVMGKSIKVTENASRILSSNSIGNAAVTIGIRPDALNVCEGEGKFEAKVNVYEDMGSCLYLHLDVNGRDLVAITREKTDDNTLKTFDIDSVVRFSFSPESVFIFDPVSGKNIDR